MPRIIAIIPVDLVRSRLGLPSLASRLVNGKPVLRHVVERVARVENIERIVLVHPVGQEPMSLLEKTSVPVSTFADPGNLRDPYHAMRTAARKWSLTAWRGGLGGMTCYDELLPAGPMLQALKQYEADAALLVGGDWILVDPALCQRVVNLHIEYPEAMQMTFTQAPPGLAGVLIGVKLIEQLAATPSATIGQILGYIPSHPQADPIGRDVCVQISAAIRSCTKRFIYDTPRTAAMIDHLAAALGPDLETADAARITQTIQSTNQASSNACGLASLPQQTTLELTPRRTVTGPITPQCYVPLNRPDMELDAAIRVVEQLGKVGDAALTLGGLGDALLHEHWDKVVEAAHAAGVLGICIETDLLVPRATLDRLMELPIDVISIRMNADRAAAYEKLMGTNQFPTVIGGLQHIYERRAARMDAPAVPWLVPRLIKTNDTLEDMERFFDKWIHHLGQAVIEPATSGCGLMPELSPVRMAPPKRVPCRQISGRMTIHANGQVARCDQDWLARAPGGDATTIELPVIWQSMEEVREAHRSGRWNEVEMCAGCSEWHRP